MYKILKVGFDLDGVILQNPLRNFRLVAKKLKIVKPFIFKQKVKPFYIPRSKFEQLLWRILHWSSWRIDPSFEEVEKLLKRRKMKIYIITARFSFLKEDFEFWKKKVNKNKIFTDCIMNKKNLQPDEFKIQMINKLKLDFFVEDNFDIVEKLNHHTKAKILWLTNFFDQRIIYPYKFFSLKEIIDYLKNQ